MARIPLKQVVTYCDRLLRTAEFQDYEGAVNGLQAGGLGFVTRIAAAVDASLATVRLACAMKVDLLLVHHGLFWGASHPWTGKRHELLTLLIEHRLAVYSSHLPLDAHPTLGNNAVLAAALGFRRTKPFFFEKGRHLGVRTETRLSRDELRLRLETAVGGRVHLIPGGPEECRRVGTCRLGRL